MSFVVRCPAGPRGAVLSGGVHDVHAVRRRAGPACTRPGTAPARAPAVSSAGAGPFGGATVEEVAAGGTEEVAG